MRFLVPMAAHHVRFRARDRLSSHRPQQNIHHALSIACTTHCKLEPRLRSRTLRKSVKKIRLNDTTKTTEQTERASKVRRTVEERRPLLPHFARAVPHDASPRARIPFACHFSANPGASRFGIPEGLELADQRTTPASLPTSVRCS
jgi:hypothetical protein